MADVNDIRNLYNEKGLTISEIHRKTGFDHKTIRIKLDQEDFKVTPVIKEKRTTLLSPYHAQIDTWLENDKKAKRKQRHTALRVFNRLREEVPGFNVSYRSVAGYGLLFPGETAECLLEGMKQMFKYIGGVPTRIWFDNPSRMVIHVKEGGERVLTESFLRFKNHFGFSAAFCNPASGHEKGHVENKVGYVRRNMLVPVPEFKSLEEYNKLQLIRCDDDMNREHYKKELPISELFALRHWGTKEQAVTPAKAGVQG